MIRIALPDAEVGQLEEVLRTASDARLRHWAQIILMADRGRRHPDKEWRSTSGVGTRDSEPGSRWGRGDSESFDRRRTDERLDRAVFRRAPEAPVRRAESRRQDNPERPHRSPGSVAPAVFAATCEPADAAPLRPPARTG